MVNASISDDEAFNEMSIDAQFMFMRTLPHLDRDGLITGNTALLWSKVAPLLPNYSTKMATIIQEWISNGFVIRYQDGKQKVLFFVNFRKNQTGMRYEKEAPSQFAPPPNHKRTRSGIVPTDDGGAPTAQKTTVELSTELVRTNSVVSRCELEDQDQVEEEEKGCVSTTRACESANSTTLPPPSDPAYELEMKQTFALMAKWDKGKPKPIRVRVSSAQAAIVAAESPPVELPSVKPADPLPTTVQPGHVISTPNDKIIIDDVTWLQMLSIVVDGLGYRELVNAGVARARSEAIATLETLAKMPAFRTKDGVEALFASWARARPDTPAPKSDWLIEHAGKLASGKVRYPDERKGKEVKRNVPDIRIAHADLTEYFANPANDFEINF